jgi:crotonobetainyl-CoA:carnitine CoA-transferase CaiB-like acyl-CoA transferase
MVTAMYHSGLYRWIIYQHAKEAKGLLEPHRKTKLDKLGFEWESLN